MRPLIYPFSLLLLAGCAPRATTDSAPASNPTTTPESPAPRAPDALARDAASDFEALERELVRDTYRVEFSLRATGLVEANLRGILRASPETLGIEATGSFAGQVVNLEFADDGERMRGRSGERKFDLPHSEHLRDAIGIGMSRMGLLHSVAVLLSGRPPDGVSGGVRDWVRVENLRHERAITDIETDTKDLPDPPLSFELSVDGQPSGAATLWYEAARSLPVERHQRTDFPEGAMKVRETYTWH